MQSRVPLIALASLMVASAAFAQSASDDFNRPNSTNLGPAWIEQTGDTIIENNMGKGKDPFLLKGFMSHATFTGAYEASEQSVDFVCNGSGQAIILLSGLNPSTWGAISVKLQDNDGDQLMDRLFFEQAFNAGSWGSGNPVIYNLATPTKTGRLSVSFTNNGDTAVCEIANATSGVTETASASGILSFAFPINGNNFGIGHSGNVSFDNWSASIDSLSYGMGCAGTGGFVPSLSASNNPVAGQPISVTLDDALGGSTAILLFGLTQAAIPIGGGCQLLVSPVLPAIVAFPLGGVGPGNGTITLNSTVPLSTSGITFTLQAFVTDGGNPLGYAATNGLEFMVP